MKRYEALYIHPGFCDGFWDNKECRYLDDDEIEDILNDNYGQTLLWRDEYYRMRNKYERCKKWGKRKKRIKGLLQGFL